MARPIFGISARRFQLDAPNSFSIRGKHFLQLTRLPTIKLRCKRHFWRNVSIDAGTSDDTKLMITGEPRRKNSTFAKVAGEGDYDGSDDLTVTLTWNEETADEHTESITFDETEYAP
jgi:hypothetical protein